MSRGWLSKPRKMYSLDSGLEKEDKLTDRLHLDSPELPHDWKEKFHIVNNRVKLISLIEKKF
jgi:hypothetical protein